MEERACYAYNLRVGLRPGNIPRLLVAEHTGINLIYRPIFNYGPRKHGNRLKSIRIEIPRGSFIMTELKKMEFTLHSKMPLDFHHFHWDGALTLCFSTSKLKGMLQTEPQTYSLKT